MYFLALNVTRTNFPLYVYTRGLVGATNIRHFRVALLKAQETFNFVAWAGDKDIITMTDGAEAMASRVKEKLPSVGAITSEMFAQLLSGIEHKHKRSMKHAMEVQFLAALRYGELTKLKASDIREDGIYSTSASQSETRPVSISYTQDCSSSWGRGRADKEPLPFYGSELRR
eukprot:GILI01044781.1.p1 GENE.GILI01044781.1~~GILI01044781.1.p1  ORF type:complete len:172 (+),score=6.41 GILI01044781.1:22-537(+)